MHQRKLIKCSFYWGLLNRRKKLEQFVAAEISTWVDCENWFLNKSPRGLCRLREFQTKHEASFHYSVHCFDHRGLDVCSTSRRSWLRFVIHVKMVCYQIKIVMKKDNFVKFVWHRWWALAVQDESCSGKEAFHWNWRRAYSQVDRRQLAQHWKHLFVLFPKQQRVVLVFGCRHQCHVCAIVRISCTRAVSSVDSVVWSFPHSALATRHKGNSFQSQQINVHQSIINICIDDGCTTVVG